MKIHSAVALTLLFPAVLLLNAKEKKPVIPAIFGQARYVYVEAIDGQEFDPNLNPEDRIAIADVRDALDDWGRYTLTMNRGEADLVVVVRKGRAASGNVGIAPRHGQLPGSAGQPGQPGSGAEFGADAGPADDLLEVCQIDPGGKLSGPLWERSMSDGLNAPRVLLLEQFEKAVDKAYPLQPPPAPRTQKP